MRGGRRPPTRLKTKFRLQLISSRDVRRTSRRVSRPRRLRRPLRWRRARNIECDRVARLHEAVQKLVLQILRRCLRLAAHNATLHRRKPMQMSLPCAASRSVITSWQTVDQTAFKIVEPIGAINSALSDRRAANTKRVAPKTANFVTANIRRKRRFCPPT